MWVTTNKAFVLRTSREKRVNFFSALRIAKRASRSSTLSHRRRSIFGPLRFWRAQFLAWRRPHGRSICRLLFLSVHLSVETVQVEIKNRSWFYERNLFIITRDVYNTWRKHMYVKFINLRIMVKFVISLILFQNCVSASLSSY